MNHSSYQDKTGLKNHQIFDLTGRTRSCSLYNVGELIKASGLKFEFSKFVYSCPSILNSIFPFLLKKTSAVAAADRAIEQILSGDGLSIAVITDVKRGRMGMLELYVDFYGNASVN